MTEPVSVDAAALRKAARLWKDAGNGTRSIVERLRAGSGGLTDPVVFGVGDNAGDQFHPKWVSYTTELTDGVEGWADSMSATGDGLIAWADAAERADGSADARASALGRLLDSPSPTRTTPGGFGGTDTGTGGRH